MHLLCPSLGFVEITQVADCSECDGRSPFHILIHTSFLRVLTLGKRPVTRLILTLSLFQQSEDVPLAEKLPDFNRPRSKRMLSLFLHFIVK
jgi:hypothetical protein